MYKWLEMWTIQLAAELTAKYILEKLTVLVHLGKITLLKRKKIEQQTIIYITDIVIRAQNDGMVFRTGGGGGGWSEGGAGTG